MKTDQLIDSLVADRNHRPIDAMRGLLVGLPPAIVVALALFTIFLGARPDIADALGSWRYLLKLLMAALIAIASTGILLQLARPQNRPAAIFPWLALVAIPLAVGFLMEGATLPREQWLTAALGKQPYFCLIFVPTFSLAPLAATLWAMRRGAPQSPTAGGAAAGLAAGGIGALVFALHCDNDSPFYIAIWYLGAIGIVTLLGAILGRRYLRW